MTADEAEILALDVKRWDEWTCENTQCPSAGETVLRDMEKEDAEDDLFCYTCDAELYRDNEWDG